VTLRIGPILVDPPVVLAPMAGVTNAPFRRLCRRFGGGLYVSEMVLARAYLEGNERTAQMVSFAEDERPRSLQLYGVDPADVGEAVARLTALDGVDHIDLNFGCPAAKVTRKGGGAAIPARPALLAAIVRAAVQAAAPSGVPVTVKFRVGIDRSISTFLTTGRIAEDEGASAVALHARTAEQHYAGAADWAAIAALKEQVHTIPVLGNGDVFEGPDGPRMLAETGCDGVVVGRGCLGRPWLFRDLARAFAGQPIPPAPLLGEVVTVLGDHARMLVEWFGEPRGCRELRKHTGWYLKGYAVGPAIRRSLASVSSLDELEALLSSLPADLAPESGAGRMVRGHTSGPRRVVLPAGWLDCPDDAAPPVGADLLVSGG
jgi:nifR3 family TIM-barrel protein